MSKKILEERKKIFFNLSNLLITIIKIIIKISKKYFSKKEKKNVPLKKLFLNTPLNLILRKKRIKKQKRLFFVKREKKRADGKEEKIELNKRKL